MGVGTCAVTLGPMPRVLCSSHLEILNIFWIRSPTFSFCIGPCKSGGLFWLLLFTVGVYSVLIWVDIHRFLGRVPGWVCSHCSTDSGKPPSLSRPCSLSCKRRQYGLASGSLLFIFTLQDRKTYMSVKGVRPEFGRSLRWPRSENPKWGCGGHGIRRKQSWKQKSFLRSWAV